MAVLLIVSLALFGFVQPVTDSAGEPQRLAGSSALVVNGSGTATVQVPSPVTVSLGADDNPNLSLETEADAAAAALVAPDGRTLLWSRADPDLLCTVATSTSCAELLSGLQVLAVDFDRPGDGTHAAVIPAGTYELHVVSARDDATTTATITASELAGETTLDPTGTVPAHMSVIRDMGPMMGVGLVAGGATGEIADDGGTLYRFVAATGSLTGSAEIGECLYGEEPPVGRIAYAPPCPGASDSSGVRFLGAGNFFTYTLKSMHVNVGAGEWSQGGYVAGPMVADGGLIVSLWLG